MKTTRDERCHPSEPQAAGNAQQQRNQDISSGSPQLGALDTATANPEGKLAAQARASGAVRAPAQTPANTPEDVQSAVLKDMVQHMAAAESYTPFTATAATCGDGAASRSLAGVAEADGALRRLSGDLHRATAVDRYIVLELLGQGGMGAVYAAYDPELDRRVALKLLRTARSSNHARKRLEREARALAKLGHPNVVQVYDAGVYQDDVFITMELVDGQSLRQWQASEPRPEWREVLAVYLDAARGLAAAHAAGLVHRDVKPANILRGKDGRVRVADFGLAAAQQRELDEADSSPDNDSSERADQSAPSMSSSSLQGSLEDRLTMTGAALGTPAYMAPEQFTGGAVGPAADQYALCAGLYEGLYGTLPFESKKRRRARSELMQSKLRGDIAPPPPSSPVPGWVHQALLRGMSARPEDRYPSMEALIAVLSDDPSIRRRAYLRWIALALVTLSLAIAAVLGWLQSGALRDRCGSVEHELAGVWDRSVKARMQEVFLATKRNHAPDTTQRVLAALDGYAGDWSRMRLEVCRARQQGETDHDVVGLREMCLERRRQQLGALTEVLTAESSPEVLDRAASAVQDLYPIEYCADVEALSARVRPPEDPKLRAQVEALQPRVARLEALHAAGKYRAGSEAGDALLAEIVDLGYPPLQAEAAYWTSKLHEEAGKLDTAEAELRKALLLAAKGGDDQLVAAVWIDLLYLQAEKQKRLADAERTAEWLPVAVERAGDELIRARWLNALGLLYSGQGHHGKAKGLHEQALAIWESKLGPEHYLVSVSLSNLGLVHLAMGQYEQARDAYERALVILDALLGPEHPHVTKQLNNLALVLQSLGQYDAAKAMYERALAIMEQTMGPEHIAVAATRSNLAGVLHAMGRHQEAASTYERAGDLLQAALGAEHPYVAYALTGRGRALVGLHQADAALEYLERALAVRTKALGSTHPELAETLLGFGEAYLAKDLPAEAAAHLERALALHNGDLHADIQLALARALWAQGQERPRAWALAQEAHTFFSSAGNSAKRTDAAEWLRQHSLAAAPGAAQAAPGAAQGAAKP